MKINCSKWPYTSFLIPAYQKIVIAKKADFHARRTSRSAHDRLANILRTHAVWASGERNAIMARGRLYNRNFGPRATITLRARSLMFYNRLSRCVFGYHIFLLWGEFDILQSFPNINLAKPCTVTRIIGFVFVFQRRMNAFVLGQTGNFLKKTFQ